CPAGSRSHRHSAEARTDGRVRCRRWQPPHPLPGTPSKGSPGPGFRRVKGRTPRALSPWHHDRRVSLAALAKPLSCTSTTAEIQGSIYRTLERRGGEALHAPAAEVANREFRTCSGEIGGSGRDDVVLAHGLGALQRRAAALEQRL